MSETPNGKVSGEDGSPVTDGRSSERTRSAGPKKPSERTVGQSVIKSSIHRNTEAEAKPVHQTRSERPRPQKDVFSPAEGKTLLGNKNQIVEKDPAVCLHAEENVQTSNGKTGAKCEMKNSENSATAIESLRLSHELNRNRSPVYQKKDLFVWIAQLLLRLVGCSLVTAFVWSCLTCEIRALTPDLEGIERGDFSINSYYTGGNTESDETNTQIESSVDSLNSSPGVTVLEYQAVVEVFLSHRFPAGTCLIFFTWFITDTLVFSECGFFFPIVRTWKSREVRIGKGPRRIYFHMNFLRSTVLLSAIISFIYYPIAMVVALNLIGRFSFPIVQANAYFVFWAIMFLVWRPRNVSKGKTDTSSSPEENNQDTPAIRHFYCLRKTPFLMAVIFNMVFAMVAFSTVFVQSVVVSTLKSWVSSRSSESSDNGDILPQNQQNIPPVVMTQFSKVSQLSHTENKTLAAHEIESLLLNQPFKQSNSPQEDDTQEVRDQIAFFLVEISYLLFWFSICVPFFSKVAYKLQQKVLTQSLSEQKHHLNLGSDMACFNKMERDMKYAHRTYFYCWVDGIKLLSGRCLLLNVSTLAFLATVLKDIVSNTWQYGLRYSQSMLVFLIKINRKSEFYGRWKRFVRILEILLEFLSQDFVRIPRRFMTSFDIRKKYTAADEEKDDQEKEEIDGQPNAKDKVGVPVDLQGTEVAGATNDDSDTDSRGPLPVGAMFSWLSIAKGDSTGSSKMSVTFSNVNVEVTDIPNNLFSDAGSEENGQCVKEGATHNESSQIEPVRQGKIEKVLSDSVFPVAPQEIQTASNLVDLFQEEIFIKYQMMSLMRFYIGCAMLFLWFWGLAMDWKHQIGFPQRKTNAIDLLENSAVTIEEMIYHEHGELQSEALLKSQFSGINECARLSQVYPGTLNASFTKSVENRQRIRIVHNNMAIGNMSNLSSVTNEQQYPNGNAATHISNATDPLQNSRFTSQQIMFFPGRPAAEYARTQDVCKAPKFLFGRQLIDGICGENIEAPVRNVLTSFSFPESSSLSLQYLFICCVLIFADFTEWFLITFHVMLPFPDKHPRTQERVALFFRQVSPSSNSTSHLRHFSIRPAILCGCFFGIATAAQWLFNFDAHRKVYPSYDCDDCLWSDFMLRYPDIWNTQCSSCV